MRFADKTTHSRHKLVHTHDRPFSCQICGMKTKHAQSLRLHCKSRHDGEGFSLKRIKCESNDDIEEFENMPIEFQWLSANMSVVRNKAYRTWSYWTFMWRWMVSYQNVKSCEIYLVYEIYSAYETRPCGLLLRQRWKGPYGSFLLNYKHLEMLSRTTALPEKLTSWETHLHPVKREDCKWKNISNKKK